MCQSRIDQRLAMTGGGCGCGCSTSFRRFNSSKEELECLEDYRDQLQREVAGVEERARELKKK